MTSVLTTASFKNIAAGVAGLLLALCCLFAAAPQAHAASLSETQIQAVLNLLTAFDVDSATISNVDTVLHGGSTDGDTGCGAKTECSYPTASIDYQSLFANTGEKSATLATISGYASGVDHVEVVMKGESGLVSQVVNGRWSVDFHSIFPGTYDVEVLDGNNINNILARGTLNVVSGDDATASSTSTRAGATITTNPTYSTDGTFVLSGRAWGASQIVVSITPFNYSGPADLQTLVNKEKGGGTQGFRSQNVYISNGRWSAQFGDIFGYGTYTARVFDYSACNSSCGSVTTFPLLATGTVIIAASSSSAPTCQVTSSSSSVISGNNYTVSWSSQNATYATGFKTQDKLPASGSQGFSTIGYPTGAHVDTLTFYGAGGTATCSAYINVVALATTPTPTLSVSPTSGQAPLDTTLYMQNLNASGKEPQWYWLNFGDGSESYFTKAVGRDAIQHTYAAAGTYSAKLSVCSLHTSEKDCDGWTGVTSVSVSVASAHSAWGTQSNNSTDSSVAVAPACPPVPQNGTSVSIQDDKGTCTVSTSTGAGYLTAAAADSASVNAPDIAGFMGKAAMAPWHAAVDSLSTIFYAAGIY